MSISCQANKVRSLRERTSDKPRRSATAIDSWLQVEQKLSSGLRRSAAHPLKRVKPTTLNAAELAASTLSHAARSVATQQPWPEARGSVTRS
jgi:hypothetical protein